MEVPPGFEKEQQVMNALQGQCSLVKEQMSGNVTIHNKEDVLDNVSEGETKKLAEKDSFEEGSNPQISNEKESDSIQEEEETNILNKSIAEIQSIINNISFFPQFKGGYVNNSDITSMPVESSYEKLKTNNFKQKNSSTTQNNTKT